MNARETSLLADFAKFAFQFGGAFRSLTLSLPIKGLLPNSGVLIVAVASASIGLMVGIMVVRSSGTGHAQGACIALDMATAYGFLDDTKRKIITRSLSQANNPYAAHFSGGYRAVSATCADIARNRWAKSHL